MDTMSLSANDNDNDNNIRTSLSSSSSLSSMSSLLLPWRSANIGTDGKPKGKDNARLTISDDGSHHTPEWFTLRIYRTLPPKLYGNFPRESAETVLRATTEFINDRLFDTFSQFQEVVLNVTGVEPVSRAFSNGSGDDGGSLLRRRRRRTGIDVDADVDANIEASASVFDDLEHGVRLSFEANVTYFMQPIPSRSKVHGALLLLLNGDGDESSGNNHELLETIAKHAAAERDPWLSEVYDIVATSYGSEAPSVAPTTDSPTSIPSALSSPSPSVQRTITPSAEPSMVPSVFLSSSSWEPSVPSTERPSFVPSHDPSTATTHPSLSPLPSTLPLSHPIVSAQRNKGRDKQTRFITIASCTVFFILLSLLGLLYKRRRRRRNGLDLNLPKKNETFSDTSSSKLTVPDDGTPKTDGWILKSFVDDDDDHYRTHTPPLHTSISSITKTNDDDDDIMTTTSSMLSFHTQTQTQQPDGASHDDDDDDDSAERRPSPHESMIPESTKMYLRSHYERQRVKTEAQHYLNRNNNHSGGDNDDDEPQPLRAFLAVDGKGSVTWEDLDYNHETQSMAPIMVCVSCDTTAVAVNTDTHTDMPYHQSTSTSLSSQLSIWKQRHRLISTPDGPVLLARHGNNNNGYSTANEMELIVAVDGIDTRNLNASETMSLLESSIAKQVTTLRFS